MSHKSPMVAGGDIRPARIIKISTAADYTVLEADANERCFGISENAAQAAPIPSADGDAASAGESLNYYGPGDECLLELGTGGATRGGMLISDANGCGVAAATTGTTLQWIAAEALESGLAAEKIRVRVCNFAHRAALS